MIDKLKKLTKDERVKKIINKIKSIPPKYGYIAIAVFAAIVCVISIISAVTKHNIKQMVTETLPQSFIVFAEDNNTVYVTDDLQLLQEFTYNDETYNIKWSSSNKKIINTEGVVVRPEKKNAQVTLTANIKKGITSVDFDYELTVICSNIINATEMQSLKSEAIFTDDFLTGMKFEKNNLVLNTDIDAALFAEYYINQLQLTPSKVQFAFEQVETSLTGKVFMLKQANNGVKLQDTYCNVFVNQKGNPIEISIHLEMSNIVSDTDLVTEQDVISAFLAMRGGDVKNIYSITEEYIDTTKMYKITHLNTNDLYVLFISQDEVIQNRVRDAKDTLKASNKTTIRNNVVKPYEAITPNTEWGINIHTNTTNDVELYTAISKNINIAQKWFDNKFNMWSFDNKGADIDVLVDKEIGTNITRYSQSLNLFYFNHTDGHVDHMGSRLDVVAHEYSHAVFNSIVGAIDKPTAEIAPIMEAYADVFACLVDNTWVVGEEMHEDGRDMRNIKDSTAKYHDESWSEINHHSNSIVLTRVAYLMSENGIKNADIAKIWYQSMFYGYHNDSTYIDVQHNLVKAATALGYSEKTINTINDCFKEIGL